MDLLKKELERKKMALQSATAAAVPTLYDNSSSKRRFFRVGKLRRLEEEHAFQEEEKKHKRHKRDEVETEGLAVGASGSQQPRDSDAPSKGKSRDRRSENDQQQQHESEQRVEHQNQKLSASEVTRELRALGMAVRLFGEGDNARLQRLQLAWKEQKEQQATDREKNEYRLGKGHGIRNPFLMKEDMSDGANLDAPQESMKQDASAVKKSRVDDEDTDDPHKLIHRYFKGLLREWEDDLTKRPEDVKRSVAGRNETKTLKQCKDYIRPLFKLCKKRNLEEGLTQNILKIVDFCKQGEFVKANDAYMEIAIGRAAWPVSIVSRAFYKCRFALLLP